MSGSFDLDDFNTGHDYNKQYEYQELDKKYGVDPAFMLC